MSLVLPEDINAMVQQSSGQINMIIAQMSDLMNNNCEKISALESQNWFKRMVNTLFGKNKITLDEIQRNHEKLNAYMCEVISELYRRNSIDERIIISLSNQINELYAGHIQLKNMLGAFAAKLNEKIESVDNFHMLEKEIEQGVYSLDIPLVSVIRIMSQYDRRILNDRRKLSILRRTMTSKGLITDDKINVVSLMTSITKIPDDMIGQVYLELETVRNNFVAEMLLEVIENYHNLPVMIRKMKKKSAIISGIIEANDVDDSVMLSVNEIYDGLLGSKIDLINSIDIIPESKPEFKVANVPAEIRQKLTKEEIINRILSLNAKRVNPKQPIFKRYGENCHPDKFSLGIPEAEEILCVMIHISEVTSWEFNSITLTNIGIHAHEEHHNDHTGFADTAIYIFLRAKYKTDPFSSHFFMSYDEINRREGITFSDIESRFSPYTKTFGLLRELKTCLDCLQNKE